MQHQQDPLHNLTDFIKEFGSLAQGAVAYNLEIQHERGPHSSHQSIVQELYEYFTTG